MKPEWDFDLQGLWGRAFFAQGKARRLPPRVLLTPQQDCGFLKSSDILLSLTMWPCSGLSHSIPNHFTEEKTEVSRLELKLKLSSPRALKRAALRMPERCEG